MRERDEATVPTTVGEEMRTNPFCRSGDEKIRKFLGMEERGRGGVRAIENDEGQFLVRFACNYTVV